jgi:transcriptional regulator with XRE-family HTH domain
MPSKLGRLIRTARHSKGMGLRELARRIEKSPAFLVSLELAEEQPGVLEDTLAAISSELGLDLDTVLALAQKVPQQLGPLSATQVALYRLIKEMPSAEQEDLKRELEKAALSSKQKARDYSKTSRGKS